MLIAFASALVTLALISIPTVTNPGGGVGLSNPYYAFAVITLTACIVLSGTWLAIDQFR
ncbi:hypothetical protein [Halorubellus sp. JP-L1]|uniref:hypothetical protein n=1 Tax=Halorubellus sp. JP-L1 TaxID=2715753 RepID=UPI001965AE5F|nr:hypothetical protein [Halorubellus sp. JP-L1]